MNWEINKDTILCMSLAQRPGNFGTRFQNFLYRKLELNFMYKAFTTQNIEAAIGGIRALGIRGCAISMPFKEVVIPLLDELDPTARDIAAVNTIVNDNGRLVGYNTDYIAIRELLQKYNVPNTATVAVLGSGGMAKAIVCALHELGFKQCTLVARNQTTGMSLAALYNYPWQKDVGQSQFDVLINATPIGMAPDIDTISFVPDLVVQATYVFDAVAKPVETKLIEQARHLGKTVISGFEITVIQAREQFKLYTGITPTLELVDQAAAYAKLG